MGNRWCCCKKHSRINYNDNNDINDINEFIEDLERAIEINKLRKVVHEYLDETEYGRKANIKKTKELLDKTIGIIIYKSSEYYLQGPTPINSYYNFKALQFAEKKILKTIN